MIFLFLSAARHLRAIDTSYLVLPLTRAVDTT